MDHLYYTPTIQNNYKVCILVNKINKVDIEKIYLSTGLNKDDTLVLSLYQNQVKKKTPVSEIQEYIKTELLPVLKDHNVEYVVVTNSDYFKVLSQTNKAVEANLGYVLYSDIIKYNIVYVPNYLQVFYDPVKTISKINQGIDALIAHMGNTYTAPGTGIIEYAMYPKTEQEIEQALQYLLEMEKPLAIDIEAFSLKHYDAGIGSIAFAWDKHSGVSFLVDYLPTTTEDGVYGVQVKNETVRAMLLAFFDQLTEKAIYHNISYDVYNLIYQLYMDHLLDNNGLLNGLSKMLSNWDDTKLISYLATNSCAGNDLSLKAQAQEYSGNYALTDIVDIKKIPSDKLLKYNLIDACSTWYVYEKNMPILINDNQLDIYTNIFKPAIVDIIQMQLTGLPINMEKVLEAEIILEQDQKTSLNTIQNSNIISEYVYYLNEQWVRQKNDTLKKKRVTLVDAKETFNPNSGPQLQELLFDRLKLPVLSFTDNKLPSTGSSALKALLNHTQNKEILELLNAIIDYKAVAKILSSFIPAFKKAQKGPDGWYYLFGSFNLGGTVSGRLSSSDPNLQNQPANSKYAKLIKQCIAAPPGWFFCGLDFASLEDRISALTTKDPNKIKVYTDGYCGHCLRAFAYFRDQMPDIVETVDSINSIQTKYKHLRQDSKAPTFALTYQGMYITLMKNCGFTEQKAKQIEARYHELYEVSDKWVASKLDEASKTGYVTAAFGLRVRTPLLHQVVRGNNKTPFQAEAEGRTAGNALGQSWGLLNNRSCSEFMTKVRTSEYKHSIKPVCHIHDAQYYLIKDDIDVLLYTNQHLVKAVEWQDHPDIQHPDVHLGGELSIFYPNWGKEMVIPNNASEETLINLFEKHINELNK